MIEKELEQLVEKAIQQLGAKGLKRLLDDSLNQPSVDELQLTIIANEALHKIPMRYLHGDVYVASKGNLDFSTQEAVTTSIKSVLDALKLKLNDKPWQSVYLVPTGHPILGLQIKNLVYHVLRLDTIDLFYSGGVYYEIEIKRRDLLF